LEGVLQVAIVVGVRGVEAVPWMLELVVAVEIRQVKVPHIAAVVHHLAFHHLTWVLQDLVRIPGHLVGILLSLRFRWPLA